jgi:tetratricopeptide (TPR) repeat protein
MKTKVILFIFLLGSISAFGQTVEEYYQQGIESYKSQKFLQAKKAFTKAIELDPNYAEAYKARGDAKSFGYFTGYESAMDDYAKAIALKPDYAEVYLSRGLLKDLVRDYQGAVEDFSKAIVIKPDYTQAFRSREEAKRSLGDDLSANADYISVSKVATQLYNTEEVKEEVQVQEEDYGIEKALRAIERLIRSQGEKFTPNSLEVNEEFVAYSKEHQKTNWWSYYGGSSTVNQSNAIYYDMIAGIRFMNKKKHYEVRILSKATKKWKIFFCWDKIIAQEGADAFVFMRTNFRKLEQPKEQPNGGGFNKYDDLEKLQKLLDSGIISQEEFVSEKKKILSQPN